jgi:phosphoserine phosphatase
MPKYDIVVFDLDGVLVDIQSSWNWVHGNFGLDNDKSLAEYLAGEINDIEFMRRDIALWKGKKPDITMDEIRLILERAPVMNGVVETISELEKLGIRRAIISGGLELLANRIGGMCRFDYIFANSLACDKNGRLTGEGISKVSLSGKDKTLLKLLSDLKIDPERCAVVGDGIVDVCMFEVAGLGIAFNPRDSYTKDGADVIIEKKDLREILKYIL